MLIERIKINNYKSIGNEQNTIILDSNVTTIIGKNESGKSNVLESIGLLPYFGNSGNINYYNNRNRVTGEDISVIFDLKFNESELKKYNLTNCETKLTFNNQNTVKVEGGLKDLIKRDTKLFECIDIIFKEKSSTKTWTIMNDNSAKSYLLTILQNLKQCNEVILLNYQQNLNWLKQKIHPHFEQKNLLLDCIEYIRQSLSNYYNLLPRIFYRPFDQQLEYSYEYQQIHEIIKDKQDIFYRLMLAAKITEDEMIKAFLEKNEGDKENIRNVIELKISEYIGKKFNDFYSQEKVNFKIVFENNKIKILVYTEKGKLMLFSERSNGLKWYLSLFIDILANNLDDNNLLFLFDEPGIHLHVNAQREILNLFQDLAKQGHQVIFTTHSPSMIEKDNILNIRAVEKNEEGITRIYRSCYDQRLTSDSKMETLSPLLKALGYDLKFNLGPELDNLNIVTEGITDYMYIKAILHYLKIEHQPFILPSAGVENINRIVSILIGWGCNFKILLDYDQKGLREYKTLVDNLDETLKNKILFINGANEPDEYEMKKKPITIENIISQKDLEKLSIHPNECKTLAAKEFYDRILNGSIVPSEETTKSFEGILKWMGILTNCCH